ncbi:VWA domain-containing protein [Mycobacterium sp. ENV421]|uniref:VWA domain-containing protein n=1 Tax=Mycobacterium sp. ENV421 TaxID=1213407 RepID=UPI000C9B4350|nr:VWA domain-containing protein [Mycobacterium sp. ENV421]PND54397.1 VWA domain-containing protein [Mycobacterium sp. ENV421]
MDAAIHRFVRLLRLAGVRVSVAEALDAMHAASQPGVLADKETLRCALAVSLLKDRRDQEIFDEVFTAFFSLVRVGLGGDEPHGHTHDDLSDTGQVESFTMSENPSPIPEQGHEHGAPSDIRDYFDPADLAQQYNLHQEANKIDLAAMTDEIAFSKENQGMLGEARRVLLEADRLRGAGVPGQLSRSTGTHVDADLSVAQEEALLAWLNTLEDEALDFGGDPKSFAGQLAGLLADLPTALKRHLEALLALEQRVIESGERRLGAIDQVVERERAELEASLRRLARSLRGALTHRSRLATGGRIDSGRTMRRNLRHDGIPFNPVTLRRMEDKPRLLVLADVSLSVRSTARFTLHLVHGLQDLFAQVRSFVFVAEVAEITELFAEHPTEHALGLIFGGDVLDVDANSDYGAAFAAFLSDHTSAVTRRTTVLILGDGRGNGNDPNVAAFEDIARRAREVIWLTPEPRYSWPLGRCDLPLYAPLCDRVEVVRNLSGLERATNKMAEELVGR